MRTRVVITGIGWITPLGHDIESAWSAILAGRSGVSPTRKFDASTFPTTFSSQVKDYDYRRYVRQPQLHEGIGDNIAFALGAARQAWDMAGLTDAKVDPARIGIYLGSGEGILDFDPYVGANLAAWRPDQNQIDTVAWAQTASRTMNAVREIEQEPNMPLAHLALEFGCEGPAYNCLTACAASTQAIGEAAAIIRRGDAQVMLTGGAHTMIHPFGVTGFNRLTALSERNDSCLTASRPFSIDRDGFVLGEGAGMLVIESLDHARGRGLGPERILAEIVGFGSTADAYRITDIHPEGRGAAKSMRDALADAGLSPDDVDYINAHGTGTKENDSIETKAVKSVFGERARTLPMSSIKSMMGHLIAAAGAVEAITCVLAIRDRKLPPTINLHNPDPACDMDYVPNVARDAKVDVCLSNSFGFGGQNDTLVLKRFVA